MKEQLERFRNKLIVFEGYDKTGKSSVAKLLADTLESEGIPTTFTFQPGDTAWGTDAAIMRSMRIDKRHNLHPLSNLFAFLLDRTEQVDKIVLPALNEGKTVISDRWWYSTIAYQFYGKQLMSKFLLSKEFAYWMNSIASLSKVPDVVFYFPEALNVRRAIDINDQFETAGNSFGSRVKDAYEDMANSLNEFKTVTPGQHPLETLKTLLEIEW